MRNYIVFIVTMLHQKSFGEIKYTDTIKVCLRTNLYCKEEVEFFREEDSIKKIRDLLPLHCKDFGEVIDLEFIFESSIINK